MRTALLSIGLLLAASGGAKAQYVPDTILSTVGFVMVAQSFCGFSVDWRRFEHAANYNGLYGPDMARHGRYFEPLQRRAAITLNSIKDNKVAGCNKIFDMLNADRRNIWAGIVSR